LVCVSLTLAEGWRTGQSVERMAANGVQGWREFRVSWVTRVTRKRPSVKKCDC